MFLGVRGDAIHEVGTVDDLLRGVAGHPLAFAVPDDDPARLAEGQQQDGHVLHDRPQPLVGLAQRQLRELAHAARLGIFELAREGRAQTGQIVLLHEVVGAAAHGGHEILLAQGAGDRDHRPREGALAEDLEDGAPVGAGQVEVGDDRVPAAFVQGQAEGGLVLHAPMRDVEAAAVQLAQQQLRVVGRVFDQK
jgi:hypothetical protein